MNFSVIDAGGLLLAVLVCGIVLVAPGYALARLFGFARDQHGRPDLSTGVVVGLAVLPALDSLVARLVGLGAALALTLILAFAAAILVWRDGMIRRPFILRRRSWIALVLLGCWFILLGVEWIDFDIAGKIYQPLTVFDTVKHASATQALVETGAPPRDAFFFRPERASYYYFFYTLAALVVRLCHGLADAKAAVGGVAFWVGVGVYGLVRLALVRAGIDRTREVTRRPLLIVAVLAAGGFDILAVLFFKWSRGYWVADPLQWNEQVGAWLEDILWVPHHVTALIAGTIGLIALCDGIDDSARTWRSTARPLALAGFAFTASLGLSVWVTFGFVLTVAVWSACLVVERRWRAVGLVLLAGAVALVLAVPQLLDLRTGRAGGGALPIALVVRGFAPLELMFTPGAWYPVAPLLALPINYAFEFGVLALGSFAYWRQARADRAGGEFARVLTIAAVSGLLIGGCLRSTLFNNDLGWRVLLLPLLSCTIWTIAVLDRMIVVTKPHRVAAPILVGSLGLGWLTVLYMAVLMRAYPFVTINPGARFIASDPATMRSLRLAYGWTTGHLPVTTVLQENPTLKRAFAFGVYGRNPIGVADTFGSLYGADPKAVAARLDQVGPIFTTVLKPSQVQERAAANGIDALVVTAADPIWAKPDSFVWRAAPIFASDRVRIFSLQTFSAMR